jgi:hypothetical protein
MSSVVDIVFACIPLILSFNNKAWQVKILEEASNSTSEGNQILVKKIDELDSRLQTLEARAALSEASNTEKVKGHYFFM